MASMERYFILLSGFFGFGEIDLATVAKELQAAGGKPLTVQVASLGGDVAEAVAIYNALAQYAEANGVDIEFDVLGYAQSAASYLIAMPGAVVKVRDNTLYMIHNPWACTCGDYQEMEAKGKWLMSMTEQFRSTYAERSGKTVDEIAALMDAETFLMGQEIIDAGFADELVQETSAAASGDKVARIAHAREQLDKLRAAAMGGAKKPASAPDNTPAVTPAAMEDQSMTTHKKKDAPAAPAAAPATDDAVARMESRARAYGSAMRELPTEMHDAVQAAFDEGKDADYFAGMVAHAKALKAQAEANEEKKKHEGAQAAGDDVPAAPAGDEGTPAVQTKPAGVTGETVEVG